MKCFTSAVFNHLAEKPSSCLGLGNGWRGIWRRDQVLTPCLRWAGEPRGVSVCWQRAWGWTGELQTPDMEISARSQAPASCPGVDLLPSLPCLPSQGLTGGGGDVDTVHPKPLQASSITHSSFLGPWHSSPSVLSRDTPKLGNSSVLPAECVHFWQQGESKQGWQHLSQVVPAQNLALPRDTGASILIKDCWPASFFLAPGDKSVACWPM